MKKKRIIMGGISAYLITLLSHSSYVLDKNSEYNQKLSAKLLNQINSSKELEIQEKDLLYNKELLDKITPYYKNTYMELLIQYRFKDLNIVTYNKKDEENEELLNTTGYYQPSDGSTIHIRSYNSEYGMYFYKEEVTHEYIHLLQSLSNYLYLKEATAEIISTEFYNTKIDSYTEETIRVKILMELIGTKPILRAVFSDDTTDLFSELNQYLSKEEIDEFMDLLKESPGNRDNQKREYLNVAIDKFLSKIYNVKYKSNIEDDPLFIALYSSNKYDKNYINNNENIKEDIIYLQLEEAKEQKIIIYEYYYFKPVKSYVETYTTNENGELETKKVLYIDDQYTIIDKNDIEKIKKQGFYVNCSIKLINDSYKIITIQDEYILLSKREKNMKLNKKQ